MGLGYEVDRGNVLGNEEPDSQIRGLSGEEREKDVQVGNYTSFIAFCVIGLVVWDQSVFFCL